MKNATLVVQTSPVGVLMLPHGGHVANPSHHMCITPGLTSVFLLTVPCCKLVNIHILSESLFLKQSLGIVFSPTKTPILVCTENFKSIIIFFFQMRALIQYSYFFFTETTVVVLLLFFCCDQTPWKEAISRRKGAFRFIVPGGESIMAGEA